MDLGITGDPDLLLIDTMEDSGMIIGGGRQGEVIGTTIEAHLEEDIGTTSGDRPEDIEGEDTIEDLLSMTTMEGEEVEEAEEGEDSEEDQEGQRISEKTRKINSRIT